MYTLRPEQTCDIKAIEEVNLLAFGKDKEGKLIHAIRESINFIPELSIVAEKNGIIGHILFSLISIETPDGQLPTLALAPVAVKPEHQNKGIGSALVREGLRIAQSLGYNHVTVLGHPDFYPKFGFEPSRPKGIEPPFDVQDPFFLVLELNKGSLDGIRGKVIYPEAFYIV